MNEIEMKKVQAYLQQKFGQPDLTLRTRKTGDSVEVLLKGEFLGVIYKDEDEGETSYDFNMRFWILIWTRLHNIPNQFHQKYLKFYEILIISAILKNN